AGLLGAPPGRAARPPRVLAAWGSNGRAQAALVGPVPSERRDAWDKTLSVTFREKGLSCRLSAEQRKAARRVTGDMEREEQNDDRMSRARLLNVPRCTRDQQPPSIDGRAFHPQISYKEPQPLRVHTSRVLRSLP